MSHQNRSSRFEVNQERTDLRKQNWIICYRYLPYILSSPAILTLETNASFLFICMDMYLIDMYDLKSKGGKVFSCFHLYIPMGENRQNSL